MSLGLAYLHEDVPGHKPAIAHRLVKWSSTFYNLQMVNIVCDESKGLNLGQIF